MLRMFSSLKLIGSTVLLTWMPLYADEAPTGGIGSDVGPTLLQLGGALLLIIGIIYLSVWLMKKYTNGRMAGGGGLISIVERRHLTPKQALYLIKIGEKHLLIGASDSGLQKLSDIEMPASRPPQTVPATGASRFSQALRQAKESLLSHSVMKEKSAEA
jgi:flagellar biosynthetic protein FliO